ncbi:MAG: tRNA uridine-5-carboxymethylaminomethyl(34) synthesis GTPase MnmE [Clostridia bacterium]|nr:tRNA uridine-5-carboxymethylaminomethyl(34) synthesis GTPase MnmE [Clostridia bacterium]
MLCETIAAVATPHGVGGISVIRISGPEAFGICDKIFKSPKGKTLSQAKSHTILYGHIELGGKTIDEVLVSVLRAPHTFTGEDTVEINCHGGITVTNAVLGAVLASGAVLAGPGEFTKRAFLNGRLDLSQAEAVIDLINAPSSLALDTATHQLEGNISRKIANLRERLINIMAQIDVCADYPEEEIDALGEAQLSDELNDILKETDALLLSAERGTFIRDGINTVIIGQPNVGKSSLLNVLADKERAIVTDIAGTTRDVIEERVNLAGLTLNVFDTAGIRDTDNPVESLGINKAEEYLQKADLVLFLIDAARGVCNEDLKIAEKLAEKKAILVINKTDLEAHPALCGLDEHFPAVRISAKTGEGTEQLSAMISSMFSLGEITADDSVTITNLRHKQALFSAKEYLSAAISSVGLVPFDLLGIDITNAISAFGEITGQTVSEEIVDRIFSRFCLGK